MTDCGLWALRMKPPQTPEQCAIAVEAVRDGVLCKGRVLLRAGALSDVEIKPAYTVFP